VDLTGSTADLQARVRGTLPSLELAGSDLNAEVRVLDARRLGAAFGMKELPAAPLTASARLRPSESALEFEDLDLALGAHRARGSGRLVTGENRSAEVRFEVESPNLRNLRAGWPAQDATASGLLAVDAGHVGFSDIRATLGQSEVTGTLSLTRGSTPMWVEAVLQSRVLDLTPYLPKKAVPEAAPGKKPELLLSERRLPLFGLDRIEGRLSLKSERILIHGQALHDCSSSVEIIGDRAALTLGARGQNNGRFDGTLKVASRPSGTPDVDLRVAARGVRTDLAGDGIAAAERPPMDLDIALLGKGDTIRALAATASGTVSMRYGAGKTKQGLLRVLGGSVIEQLAVKLNPFIESDPYTRLECLIVRAKLVDGLASVDPVLMQSEKVVVAAQGNIDLRTEKLTFDFSPRPRRGIGISTGMFTTPFIQLEGTLANPRIGVGVKGVASGAAAAVTGGLTVLAEGLIDRVRGELASCGKAGVVPDRSR
jgi:uncharacterized protein involved in outer membrane biogenesis